MKLKQHLHNFVKDLPTITVVLSVMFWVIIGEGYFQQAIDGMQLILTSLLLILINICTSLLCNG